MESAAGTVSIGGRTVGVVGSISTMAALALAEHERAIRDADVEMLSRIETTSATITMSADTTSADAHTLIRLFSAANGFDVPTEPGWWPSPQPIRPPLHRARRIVHPRQPRAPRLVSWLVRGRGR